MTELSRPVEGVPTFDTSNVDSFLAEQAQISQLEERGRIAETTRLQERTSISEHAGLIMKIMEASAHIDNAQEASSLFALLKPHGMMVDQFDFSLGKPLFPEVPNSYLNRNTIKDTHDIGRTVRATLLGLVALSGIGFTEDEEAKIIATYDSLLPAHYPQYSSKKVVKMIKQHQSRAAASLDNGAMVKWLRNREGLKLSGIYQPARSSARVLASNSYSFYGRHFTSKYTKWMTATWK